MRKRAPLRRLSVALLTLGLAACATGSAGEAEAGAEATGDEIRVEIVNDLVPSASVAVWIVPETGSRRRLGSVTANGRQTFTYLPTVRSMDHRLVADVSGGGTETSQRFSLQGVGTVSWSVSNPNVMVR